MVFSIRIGINDFEKKHLVLSGPKNKGFWEQFEKIRDKLYQKIVFGSCFGKKQNKFRNLTATNF